MSNSCLRFSHQYSINTSIAINVNGESENLMVKVPGSVRGAKAACTDFIRLFMSAQQPGTPVNTG